jgi:hypothetical protein
MTWFRTMALAWLTAWMLVVPLVHVHPEVDHRHGDVGHTHGGVAHTVFSPDLSCEYAIHHDDASLGDAATSFEVIDPSTHALNHPEFGFDLALSGDHPLGKPAPIDTVSSAWQNEPEALTSSSVPLMPLASPPCLFLSASFSPRAPPFPSI